MENKRAIGTKYEQLAGKFLEANGLKIIEYNFKAIRSEIDIVAKDKETLVFVEVKYRTDASFGEPYASVDLRKQRKLREAAREFLGQRRIYDNVSCRFDVVSITGGQINWIKDAF